MRALKDWIRRVLLKKIAAPDECYWRDRALKAEAMLSTKEEINEAALVKWAETKASELCEHFDSVQIFACVTRGATTHNITTGLGSWYERQGMAHRFIDKDKARHIANAITESQTSDGDDDWKQNA